VLQQLLLESCGSENDLLLEAIKGGCTHAFIKAVLETPARKLLSLHPACAWGLGVGVRRLCKAPPADCMATQHRVLQRQRLAGLYLCKWGRLCLHVLVDIPHHQLIPTVLVLLPNMQLPPRMLGMPGARA
jgi:hypothetical protein